MPKPLVYSFNLKCSLHMWHSKSLDLKLQKVMIIKNNHTLSIFLVHKMDTQSHTHTRTFTSDTSDLHTGCHLIRSIPPASVQETAPSWRKTLIAKGTSGGPCHAVSLDATSLWLNLSDIEAPNSPLSRAKQRSLGSALWGNDVQANLSSTIPD